MRGFGMYFTIGNIYELAQQLHNATEIDWKKESSKAIEIAKRFDISNIIEQWKNIIYE